MRPIACRGGNENMHSDLAWGQRRAAAMVAAGSIAAAGLQQLKV